MRGNDLLMGTPDVMVTDSLTGNLFMKIFSSYTTGGDYEAEGYGYGPGVGENYDRRVLILQEHQDHLLLLKHKICLWSSYRKS